jgi:hypothetical protein
MLTQMGDGIVSHGEVLGACEEGKLGAFATCVKAVAELPHSKVGDASSMIAVKIAIEVIEDERG